MISMPKINLLVVPEHVVFRLKRDRLYQNLIVQRFTSGFKVTSSATIFSKAKVVQKVTSTVVDDLPFVHVKIGAAPSHLALSSDDLTLAVCVMNDDDNAYALMYDIRAFASTVCLAAKIGVITAR